MDTCWHSCIKYIIVIFNLLLALAGLAIIGVGAYIQIGAKHYLDFLDTTLLAQFGSAIAAFVLKDDLTESIEHKMTAGLHNYNKTGYAGVTETWDYVQQSLTCCGVTNNTDWTAAHVKTP